MSQFKWLTLSNPKTLKGEASGYMTAIIHLAPARSANAKALDPLTGLSPSVNVCPWATKGCLVACLNISGHGAIFKAGETTNAIQEARKRRTRELFADWSGSINAISREIELAERKAQRQNLKLCVRPNGTSDILLLAVTLAKRFPHIRFYDYTKRPVESWGQLPANYSLTVSWAETTDAKANAFKALNQGINVAMVFDTPKGKPLPMRWSAFPVVEGDNSDLRFLDPKGSDGRGLIVGLHAKGKAKKDVSGFVVKTACAG